MAKPPDVDSAYAMSSPEEIIAHYTAQGFDRALAGLAARISDPQLRDVRIYDDRADESHRNDMARLLIFETP